MKFYLLIFILCVSVSLLAKPQEKKVVLVSPYEMTNQPGFESAIKAKDLPFNAICMKEEIYRQMRTEQMFATDFYPSDYKKKDEGYSVIDVLIIAGASFAIGLATNIR